MTPEQQKQLDSYFASGYAAFWDAYKLNDNPLPGTKRGEAWETGFLQARQEELATLKPTTKTTK